jgi:YidC/Oxa1 family membrane protein insertase
MQIQNFQRYIIWGLLAAVGYLMLIQWQKDYGKATTINLPISTSTTQQTTNSPSEVSTEKQTKNEDIPELIITPKEKERTIQTTENTNRLIFVKTENMNLTIDLIGGDIVVSDLSQYSVDVETPENKVKILQNDETRTYIAQSGIIGTDGPDANPSGRPLYKTEYINYEKPEGENEFRVPLYFQDEFGLKTTKTFIFKKDSYAVDIEYEIENQSAQQKTGSLFAQIKRDNTIDPLADTSIFAMKPFLGVAFWAPEKKYNKISIEDIKEEPIKITHQGGWLAFVQHYFISAWIAPKETNNTFTTRVNSNNENIVGFTTAAFTIEAGQTKKLNYTFYVGPKNQEKLKEISDGLDLTVDYGWLWMIAQAIFAVLIFIQKYVGNWGWSIVLLTCTVKLLFFPLNQYAFKSMANLRKLQPKMQKLKEQFGDDRQKLSQATMEMYRKEKINPLGSCLPMLIQMPVFIALYWVLSESVEIRHAEFIGWIKDLSIMDPYFVLPGLMAITMVIQQKLSPMVFQDPMQEKVMKYMPIMFAVFFLFFPAGLVLYWLVNNILTIAQQWVINRSIIVEK